MLAFKLLTGAVMLTVVSAVFTPSIHSFWGNVSACKGFIDGMSEDAIEKEFFGGIFEDRRIFTAEDQGCGIGQTCRRRITQSCKGTMLGGGQCPTCLERKIRSRVSNYSVVHLEWAGSRSSRVQYIYEGRCINRGCRLHRRPQRLLVSAVPVTKPSELIKIRHWFATVNVGNHCS